MKCVSKMDEEWLINTQYYSHNAKNDCILEERRKGIEIVEKSIFLLQGGTYGVIVTVIGNRHNDASSNPGQGCLYFT